MEEFPKPRLKVVLAAAIGLPLATFGALLAFAFLHSRCGRDDESIAEARPSPRAAPAVKTAEERVVTFLLHANSAWEAAGSACFAAERCGDVESQPHRGSVGSESEVAPCFDTRIPACVGALATLQSLQPPPELAEVWPLLVRRRVEMSLELARRLEDVWLAHPKHPRLRAPGKDYGSLVDWARRNDPEFSAFLSAREEQDRKLMSAFELMNQWTRDHALCNTGVNCNFEKVMGGAPIDLAENYRPLVRR